MADKSNHEKEIFDKAFEIEGAEERLSFLQAACRGDQALLKRIQALLQASVSADDFLPEQAKERVLTEKPGDRIGHYKLLQKIGEGGCGVVYMAEQEEPVRRRVALKIIKLGMDTKQVIARFEAERQALAMMDHPNIAKVLDAGATDTGRPYFVMELVRGIKITEFCDQNNLSTAERLKLFIPVCQAIQHAHQKGIIHRDVKPSNILVTLNDGAPLPKVIDFGIAKATQGRLTDQTLFTAFEQFIGTPAYMSPEQAAMTSMDIDARSDIYSLGVLLYELLTGGPPFNQNELLAAGLDEMRRTIQEKEPLRPSTCFSTMAADIQTTTAKHRCTEAPKLIHLLRGDLDWIVMKCLEKDRKRRYETANGLAVDIERHLDNEPVAARPPSALYRWQKFARKHRTGVVIAAGFVLVLTMATFLSASLALWANRERQVARASDAEARGVLKFFEEHLLAAARPEGEEGGLGHDITLRAAVDAAEPAIATSFTNQPLAEAAIRDTLGGTYAYLGDHTAAYQQHQRAWELFRTILGLNHTNTLDAAHGVAANLHEMGEPAKAVPLFEDILHRRQVLHGTNSLEALRVMCALGSACRAAGDLGRALTLLEQALPPLQTNFGSEHVESIAAMNLLAMAYRDAGQTTNEVQLLEEVLRLRQQDPEATPASLTTSMNNLARAYEENNRLEDAAALVEDALKLAADKLPPDHPGTLTLLNTRGWLNVKRGDLKKAIPQLEEALEATEQRQGPEHPDTAGSMNYLAIAYWYAGDTNKAVQWFEKVLRVRRIARGPDHPETLSSMNDLGIIYRRLGQPEKALPLHEEAWKQLTARLGPDNPSTLVAMNSVILVYVALNRLDDALPLFDEALRLRVANNTATDSDIHATIQGLALACLQAGRFAEAESRLCTVSEAQRDAGPEAEIQLAENLVLLGDVLLRQGQPAAAESPLKEGLRIREARIPDDWRTFNTQSLLGGCFLGQTNYQAARPLLLSGYEGMKQREASIPPAARPRLREAVERLVQLFDKTGPPGEAAGWKQKLEALDNSKN